MAETGELKKEEAELRRVVELSPNNPKSLANLGHILADQGKSKEAKIYFEKALELDPGDLMVRYGLAATQLQMGQFREAQDNLERILKLNPHDGKSTLMMGIVAEKVQDFAKAVRLLESLPNLVKQQPGATAALAHSYYKTRQPERARVMLQALIGHSASEEDLFLGGQVAAEEGDYEMAEKLFTSISPGYSDRAKLGYNLALVRYRSNRFRDGEETLLDLIGSGHQNGEILNLLGWCYYKQKKVSESLRAFDIAIDLEPSKEINYLDVGTILMEENLLPLALKVSEKAVERIPTSYLAHMMRGLIEYKENRFVDAVRSYSRAIELNGEAPEANASLGLAQFEAGMRQESVKTFEKGIDRFPRDALHCQEYAKVLLKLAQTGDATTRSRAEALLQRALSLDNSLAESHYQLGNLWLEEGKYREALPQLQTAVQLEPKQSKIRFALSRTYRSLALADQASEQFRIYQTLKADEERALRARARLETSR